MQPRRLALLIACLMHVALEKPQQGCCAGTCSAGVVAARILQQDQPIITPPEPLNTNTEVNNPTNIEITEINSPPSLAPPAGELSETEFPVVPSSELLVTSSSEPFPTGNSVQYLRPEDQVQVPAFPGQTNPPITNTLETSYTAPEEAQVLPTSSFNSNEATLTSLLAPLPPNTPTPSLNATQLANIPLLQKMRQGVATVVYQRSVGNYDGINMNCGTGYLNNYFKDHFIGVSLPMYRNGEVCGACVQLYCVDSACTAPLVANKTFMVVDSCRECKGNDIVISARGSLDLSGVNYNVNPSIQVAWRVTSCAPLLIGGIRMLPSKNNSPVFLGLNFSNLKVLLQSVAINGIPMQRTDYGAWVIDSPGQNIPLTPPYALQLKGVNEQVLTMRVAGLVPQDLGVNFEA